MQALGVSGGQVPGAMHHLGNKDPSRPGPGPDDSEFGANQPIYGLKRVVCRAQMSKGIQVTLGDAVEHLLIEVFFGVDVVGDVGPGQAAELGHFAQGGGGKALAGKGFGGDAQNQRAVAPARLIGFFLRLSIADVKCAACRVGRVLIPHVFHLRTRPA
ncbi:hypothetical protein D3C84_837080 [compost metagenome]